MALADDLSREVRSILSQSWSTRVGRVVPTTDDIALAGEGVVLKSTVLYADLADSTSIAMGNQRTAARLFKAFLGVSSRIIRAHDGHIRSFDGDRVMGVFVGDRPNTRAVKAGLQINWAVTKLIKPKFEAVYTQFSDGTYPIQHCTGIDTSDTLVVRAGVHTHNDLVWVGQAPNVAAKLCSLRNDPYFTWVSGRVYGLMADESKYGGDPKQNMWEERSWTDGPIDRVFRSSWWWKP